ncbi:MAG: 2-hydroxymuconate tautomerase [bacterium]
MPLVKIEMYPGRTKETKKKLIEAVTKDVAEIVACPLEAVTVVIQDIEKENWGFGGKQSS